MSREAHHAGSGTADGVSPVAIVTGAGSGIGRSVTAGLLTGGWTVILVGRRTEALEETAAMAAADGAGGRAVPLTVDVTADDGPDRIIAAAVAEGPLRALVNNAGLAELAPIGATNDAMIDRALAVNLSAPLRLVARAWPHLAAATPDRPGVVVNVSSVAAADPFPGFLAYAASKAGVESIARSVANEAGDAAVQAWNIAPGAVETPMLRGLFDESMVPSSMTVLPEDVAGAVLACVAGITDAPVGETISVAVGAPAS